jgi:hypothetical protein
MHVSTEVMDGSDRPVALSYGALTSLPTCFSFSGCRQMRLVFWTSHSKVESEPSDSPIVLV